MTNTRTTTTKKKTSHFLRALLAALATLVAMLAASGAALAATTVQTGNISPIQIADNGPASLYPSQANVQNLDGNIISDLDVQLHGFRHNFPDDVDVLLVGPRGQKVLLMSDVGGDVDVTDTSLVFDDEATNSLPDSSRLTDGFYKPTRGTNVGGGLLVPANFPAPAPAGPYATRLSAFDGTNPNGTWKLYVIDDSSGQAGVLQDGWLLSITIKPDTIAPKVTSTAPQAGATGVAPTANVKSTFSEDMQASTIGGATFELFKKGSTNRLSAKVAYDAKAHRAILDPTNPLRRGATYKAVVTTGAKDLAGNPLDQNPSLSGLQQKAWSFKVRN
jgi:subtilisin-like proprotein convertase family protein